MTHFRKLTVKYLRELARKHLGRGYTGLKKADLLRAVSKWLPKPLVKAARATKAAPRKTAAKVSSPKEPASRRKTPRRTKEKIAPIAETAPAKEEDRVAFVEDGFFEIPPAARPKQTPSDDTLAYFQPAQPHRNLLVALIRDPSSVYVFASFEVTALASLDPPDPPLVGARPALRVYEGDRLVQQHYLRPNAGALYLYGLSPGKRYVIEAVAVGQDGESKSLGLSASVELPSVEPSASSAIRLLHLPWLTPLNAMGSAVETGKASLRVKESAVRELPRTQYTLSSSRLDSPSSLGIAPGSSEQLFNFSYRRT